MHRVSLDTEGRLVLKSDNQPAFRLAPQQGRKFRVVELEGFVVDPEQTRRRNREVAERLFDVRRVGVERYAHLYESVLGATD